VSGCDGCNYGLAEQVPSLCEHLGVTGERVADRQAAAREQGRQEAVAGIMKVARDVAHQWGLVEASSIYEFIARIKRGDWKAGDDER
jgi:hypothetical protein